MLVTIHITIMAGCHKKVPGSVADVLVALNLEALSGMYLRNSR